MLVGVVGFLGLCKVRSELVRVGPASLGQLGLFYIGPGPLGQVGWVSWLVYWAVLVGIGRLVGVGPASLGQWARCGVARPAFGGPIGPKGREIRSKAQLFRAVPLCLGR